MRLVVTSAAWVGLAVCTAGVPLLAQFKDNTEKRLTCDNGGYDGDRARHCEIREQGVPSVGNLTIDAGRNGGATVKGWSRNDVLVRARVEASGETEGAAANLASRINIESAAGQVRATGPEATNNYGWSVSYEIFVPHMTDVSMKTHNGGVAITDVRGRLQLETHNGGVSLKRVMGDVTGTTYNGGISVEMAGTTWDGRQMELNTHNGGVTVTMPAQFSARVQAETGMGRIHSDFPMPQEISAQRSRKVEFSIGGGGAPIHITTQNGGITLKRAGAE
jgi:DUF4097 and DUF4098 domain-containing protein YvlB